VAHGFRLLSSHDQCRYMVLQHHPLVFICLILVGLAFGFYVCLTCVGGHSFSHSMNTHEPFVRFDGLLDFFSCGLGRVREHAYRASLLVHDSILVMLLLVLLMLVL
jgi:hypothetical protein